MKLIFQFTGEKRKLNLIKHNKIFQKKLDINIFYYKKILFTKDIPEITKSNLLDYYDYLKRKYINKYSLEDLQNYFAEFFCKFIEEKNINFELNISHESAREILLCNSLKSINLILNLNDYKSSFKTEKITDKNKKPFIGLFQTIFDIKRISKISQITIISKNEKINDDDLFIQALVGNIYKFKPIIKTQIKSIYKCLFNYVINLKNFDIRNYDIDIFKLWKLIVPFPDNSWYEKDYIETIIQFDIDLDKPFTIEHLDFIKRNKLKNYFVKLNYEDLWSFNDDFTNIRKLELTIKKEIVSDVTNFSKVNEMILKREIDEGKNKGIERDSDEENKEAIRRLKKNFNNKNTRYIQYFNKLYYLYKNAHENKEGKNDLKILNLMEKSEFDDLAIIYTLIKGNKKSFSINKLTKAIELCIFNYNIKEKEFLNKLKAYESVKLEFFTAPSEENKKEYNLFKYDENSQIKYLYLSIIYYDFIPRYYLDFPINFEKIITLDLTYTLVLNNTTHINFPLTEKQCQYKFPNLKNLKLNFCYDCEGCIEVSPKDLIPNLSNNFKFCPALENLVIYYEIFELNQDELQIILKGIKILKNMNSLYINTKYDKRCIITTDEFFKSYPKYINYCPFLNDIKIEVSESLKNDLFYEKNINYKINDIVINDYLYIKTLGQKSSYTTYLCKNKNNEQVVIRKFKKSRINNSIDLFENEKYCLKKFKNDSNVINYIEFLSDEYFEYIVYEYIEDIIKHYKSKIIKNKVCDILDKFYNFQSKKEIY